MNEILKKLALTSIMQDVLLIVFGLIIINMQVLVLNIFVIAVGAFFILKGVMEICRYAIAKGISEFYKDELWFGILSIILGIIFILEKNAVGWIFRISVAVYIIYSAIKNLVVAYKVRKYKIISWIPMAIICTVMFILRNMYIKRHGKQYIRNSTYNLFDT